MGDPIPDLLAWASSHGTVLHPNVEIYGDPTTGLSFRVRPDAPEPLAPWEPVVALPTHLSFSYLDALPGSPHYDPAHSLPRELLDRTPPHALGRLLLAKHHLLGRASFWHPYVAALADPEDAEAWALPPFWDREERELLEGTNVEVGLDKIRGDVDREWDAARELLKLYGDETDRAITRRLYEWAYCVFSSRSFRPSLVLSDAEADALPRGVAIDDFSVLLPVFDLGNHDMTAPVRWELQASSSAGRSSCELRVGREHAPGQQVFNNYSIKTNAELLLGYGFMIPPTDALHNDYTHVRKRTDDPKASEEYYISRRPMDHPSSLLGRHRTRLHVPMPPGRRMLAAFAHVQADMVWDIFCTLTPPDERARILPTAAGSGSGSGSGSEEEQRQARFFTGDVGAEDAAREKLEHTLAVVQNKVLQELERLEETDVEVGEDELAALSGKQALALEYRQRCRAVLEATLESMSITLEDGLAQ